MKGGFRRAGVLAAFIVIAQLAVALPAGAAEDPTVDLAAVEAIPARMEKSGSVRFSGRVTITSSGTQAYVEYAVAGASDLNHDRSAWKVDVAIGEEGSARVVSTTEGTFLSVTGGSGPPPEALEGKRWVRFPANGPDEPGSLTGPRRSVPASDQPGIAFEVVGPARLNGIATTRIHMEWPQELPAVPVSSTYTVPAETNVQRMDLWIDAEGRLRREASVVVFRQGRYDYSVRTLMDYERYGKPVKVVIPDAASTIDADDLDTSALPVV